MSTALRIAAVTQVLKDLLNDGLINNDVSGITQNNITVTALSPDKIQTGDGTEVSSLNIFMYQASYNQGWRNIGLPSINSNGERITNPPLAIDLHYILTAYGASELHTDILLGMGMKFFHENPILSRELIAEATEQVQVGNDGNSLPESLSFLSQSFLANQIELVKIIPEVFTIDEISKLWTALGAKYRPTAAYKATVVLIESEKPAKAGLPVKERNIYVKPINTPYIENILSQSAIGQPISEQQKILSGYRLILRGYNLLNEKVEVNIDGETIDASISEQKSNNSEISFTLPIALPAGMHNVKVVHPILIGTPPEPRKWVNSVPKLFTLSPRIANNISVNNKTINTEGLVSATISTSIEPMIHPGQKLFLLLNEYGDVSSPKSYSFQMNDDEFGEPKQAISNIQVDINGVKPATYLARVQINGAASDLDTTGDSITPVVTI